MANLAQYTVTEELLFLAKKTGRAESDILAQALNVGLNLLYKDAVEQAFIDEQISRSEAVAILGGDRIAELEYAMQSLSADIAWGLN